MATSYTTHYQATPDRIKNCSTICLHLIQKAFTLSGINSYWTDPDVLDNHGLMLSRSSYDPETETSIFQTTENVKFDSIFYLSEVGDILGYTAFSTTQDTTEIELFKVLVKLEIEPVTFRTDLTVKFDLTGNRLIDPLDSKKYIDVSDLPTKVGGYSRFTNNFLDQRTDSSISVLTNTGIWTSDNTYSTINLDSGVSVKNYKTEYNYYHVGIFDTDICLYMINTWTGSYQIVSLETHNFFGLPKIMREGVLPVPEGSEISQVVGKLIVVNGSTLIDISGTEPGVTELQEGTYILPDSTLTRGIPDSKQLPGSEESLKFIRYDGSWCVYKSLQDSGLTYYVNHFGLLAVPANWMVYLYSSRSAILKDLESGKFYFAITDNGVEVNTGGSLDQYIKAGYLSEIPENIIGSQLVDGMRHEPLRTSYFPDPICVWSGFIFYIENSKLYIL